MIPRRSITGSTAEIVLTFALTVCGIIASTLETVSVLKTLAVLCPMWLLSASGQRRCDIMRARLARRHRDVFKPTST